MPGTTLQESRILIIDDQQANVRVLEFALQRAGYTNIKTTTDSREALPLFLEYQPDLILLDLLMPYVDGFEVMQQLNLLLPPGSYLPILVLTADITPDIKRRALASGAKDFLVKPFDAMEVLLRIHNLLETRSLHLQLQSQNKTLEKKVQARTEELAEAQIEIIQRLAQAAEFRDDDTGHHTQRVGELAARLATALQLPDKQIELIRRAAPLHDVGKIGIPDSILLKPGKHTLEEFEQMKAHTTIGARILSGSRFSLLRLAEKIALTHHERWDGTGYPLGLTRDDIPLVGRVVAVVDVYDALTHKRPYKSPWPEAEALAEIERERGVQFDPQVVDAFLRVMEDDTGEPTALAQSY
jgi:putative two-component system response regulator